jgi:AraC-like DNA-binding protein
MSVVEAAIRGGAVTVLLLVATLLLRDRRQFPTGNLSEAMAALTDPSQSSVPTLTIALDTGFGSVGPFNRAFKAPTGMTPTEYRRERLGGTQNAADLSPFPKSASLPRN